MTRDDIIRMMQSVCDTDKVDAWHNEFWTVTQDELDRFAALIAAAEREACAKVCEEKQSYFTPIPCPDGISGCLVAHHGPVQRKKTATECAAAIRARGEV